VEPITNHFNQGLVKLVPPFWGKPRMASLLLAMLNRVQELEDATWDVLDRYTLDGADDARLAVLGRIVGQHNAGWDTETYRMVLRGKIRANKSRGVADDIIAVLQLIVAAAIVVTVDDFSPATIMVQPQQEVSDAQVTAIAYLLPKTRAAGVQQHVVLAPSSVSGSYSFGTAGIILGSTTTPGTPAPGLFDVRVL
jgi:hypothetical protein